MRIKQISSWGNYPKISAQVFSPEKIKDASQLIQNSNSIIPRGSGRSYGDASLNNQVLSTKNFNKIISFDESTGVLKVQSGVLLDDVLKLTIPKGYFLQITPGTKYISIGGAIAADVHGKNHHKVGCFSNCVTSFELINQQGVLINCSATENSDIFLDTFGSMGLTGLITSVELKLIAIQSSDINVRQIQVRNLEEMMDAFQKNTSTTYSVAWIDCLAKGKNLGRGVISLGEHSSEATELKYQDKAGFKIPFYFPNFSLNKISIGIFNMLYYAKGKSKEFNINYDAFFYPLDGLKDWNKIYGKNGFIQYQFVLPLQTSKEGLEDILQFVANSKTPPFLSVLKLFGKENSSTPHSFPMEGYTLAMDFKWHPGVDKLIRILDQKVTQYKGRVYLAKDAGSSASLINNRPISNDTFSSLQTKRLDLNIVNNQSKKAFILGGTSDVAIQLTNQLINDGWSVTSSVRNVDNPLLIQNDKLTYVAFDLTKPDWQLIDQQTQEVSVVFSFIGYCPIPQDNYSSTEEINKITFANYNGLIPVLEKFVHVFEQKGQGTIVGVSSVAGNRGRATNYLYGSAKAGFTTYLSGIRNRLAKKGVHVMTVLPGFMDTKMTKGLDLPKPLTVNAEQASSIIYSGFKKQKDVIYVSWKWKYVMKIITSIPEFIFKKLNL
jgi:FAD/FMN-containing dehydrogenase/short-subunit dehydrogenase